MPKYADDDPRAPALMAAIRDARRERMSQVELAEKLGVRQTYVSRWETERPPRMPQVQEIELALGLPSGTLLRRAGYIEDETDIEAAILGDDRLTPDYQQIVLSTYRMAVRNSAEARTKAARSAELARKIQPGRRAPSSKSATAGSSRPSRTTPKPVRTRRTS